MAAYLPVFMLAKSTVKLIRSLKDKRQRYEEKLFVAEGVKSVIELLSSKLDIESIFATESWYKQHQQLCGRRTVEIISEKELDQVSNLKTTQDVLLLARIPDNKLKISSFQHKISLALDTIQDPGNLGSIIRIADWFGIENILCSPSCADAYNSKAVQASMASIARVNIFYEDLENIFKQTTIKVYGAIINGKNIYKEKLPSEAIILIGNEGQGIDQSLEKFIHVPISIPRIGHTESLNAALATGIICAEFKRSLFV